ncbi:MAG: hypothetical protein K2X27_21980, partial [Candidatus Obscuribacterales bacterium]|nr:hypothetical protein [Candidatus Obscuribacterales bacterium]
KKHAASCVHQAEGQLKHRFVTPTYAVKAGADDQSDLPKRSSVGHYLQMYDWDACFFAQAAKHIHIYGLPPEVVANFLDLKDSDGHIPRTISPQRIWDAGDNCKPFLCQTALAGLKEKNNLEISDPLLLEKLSAYLKFFETNRRNKNGLFHWRNVLESGVDDNLALLYPREAAKDEDKSVQEFPDGRLLAVDLSTYIFCEYKALAELSLIFGNQSLAEQSLHKAEVIQNAIENLCWNEKIEMYSNLDPEDDSLVPIRAWTGMMPALLGLASPERREQVFKQNLLNEKQFFRPAGMSSVAASEPLYNNAVRGLYGRAIVSHWQGPVWVLSNALAVRALLQNDMKKEAQQLSMAMLSTLNADLEKSGTLHENYHAETAAALWAPQFMSWNILALEMIEILS